MNELVKRILIGCVGFGFVYLMGSFYNASFDISKWNISSRFVVAMLGGFISVMLATFPGYDFKNK
jgi:hypothetical protein